MNIPMWTCDCGKTYTMGVKTCKIKQCGGVQKKYELRDEPTIRPDRKVDANEAAKRKQRNENNRKLSRLPKPEEGKFYISTFKKQ